jgi:hypothetical protein
MDNDSSVSADLVPVAPSAPAAPLPPAACPPMSRDTGRAAVGRAGSFNLNSGKNGQCASDTLDSPHCRLCHRGRANGRLLKNGLGAGQQAE